MLCNRVVELGKNGEAQLTINLQTFVVGVINITRKISSTTVSQVKTIPNKMAKNEYDTNMYTCCLNKIVFNSIH